MSHVSAIFLGDIGVGKTTFLTSVSEGRLRQNIQSTLGVDNIIYRKNNKVLRCWDTSGSDRFIHVVPLFARKCDIAVYIYDAKRPQTFENITKWHDLVSNVEDAPKEHIIIALNVDDNTKINSHPDMDILDGRYAHNVMREIIERCEEQRLSFDLEIQSSQQRQCCFGFCT